MRRALRIGLSIAIFLSLMAALYRCRAQLDWSRVFAHPVTFFICIALYAPGFFISFYGWLALVNRGAQRIRVLAAFPIFVASTLSRYLPGGGAWQLVALYSSWENQELRAQSVSAQVLSTLLAYAAGCLLAAVGIPLVFPQVSWLAIPGLVVPMLVGLWLLSGPGLTSWLGRAISWRFPSFQSVPLPRTYAFGFTAAYLVLGWLMEGVAACLLLGLFRPRLSWHEVGIIVCGQALAVLGGYLTLFVPGGIGVREGLFILILRTQYGAPISLFVVIALRTCSLLCELAISLPWGLKWLLQPALVEQGQPLRGARPTPKLGHRRAQQK